MRVLEFAGRVGARERERENIRYFVNIYFNEIKLNSFGRLFVGSSHSLALHGLPFLASATTHSYDGRHPNDTS